MKKDLTIAELVEIHEKLKVAYETGHEPSLAQEYMNAINAIKRIIQGRANEL